LKIAVVSFLFFLNNKHLLKHASIARKMININRVGSGRKGPWYDPSISLRH